MYFSQPCLHTCLSLSLQASCLLQPSWLCCVQEHCCGAGHPVPCGLASAVPMGFAPCAKLWSWGHHWNAWWNCLLILREIGMGEQRRTRCWASAQRCLERWCITWLPAGCRAKDIQDLAATEEQGAYGCFVPKWYKRSLRKPSSWFDRTWRETHLFPGAELSSTCSVFPAMI